MKSTGEHVSSLERRLKALADHFGAKPFTVPKLPIHSLSSSGSHNPRGVYNSLSHPVPSPIGPGHRTDLVPILEPKILPRFSDS